MAAGRRFLVFEVPAQQTRVGAITLRRPGATVDLIGKPLIREEGHSYLLHYVVQGIDVETRDAILGSIMDTYDDVETLRWDAATGHWEVRGIIRVENIRSKGLRFVAGLFGLAEAPWVEFRDGKALVRLYPKEPQLMVHLAEAVDARLATLGIEGHPRIEAADLDTFRKRAACVGLTIPVES